MRAAVAQASGELRIETLERPAPRENEVRVRVEACGLCGSDLHFYGGRLLAPGQIPGHEIVGRIEARGPGVSDPIEGARIAVEPVRGCGSCTPCRDGRANVCRAFRLHGLNLPGGFAEAVVVRADRCFPVAADVDPAVAAMAEPLAVSIHGLERGGFEGGQRVLILGAGSIGLVTAIVARAMGAGEIWISARHAGQAELAKQLGAHHVLAESDASPQALDALGREKDFDLVVETVGSSADTLRSAGAAVRPGGAISVLGVFMGAVQVEPTPLLLKEATLAWSNCYQHSAQAPADFAVAAGLVDTERERLSLLTTHRIALDRIDQAYRIAGDKRSGSVKVSVLPQTVLSEAAMPRR